MAEKEETLLDDGNELALRFERAFRHSQTLRSTSRTTSILAAILAFTGIAVFWRLRILLSAEAGSAHFEMLYRNVLLPFLLFATGCFVISLVALFLTSRQHKKLRFDKNRLEVTELAADMLAQLDDEHMQSFSSWLHDNVGHDLVLIKMDIEYLLRNGRLSPEDAKKSAEHVDKMLAEVRSMASTLYPKLLSEAGLAAALESLIEHYRTMSHLDVDYAIGKLPEPSLDKRRALVIYRTVQECLTNAAKYGSAEFVWVSVQKKNGKICGTILNHVTEKASGNSENGHYGGIGLDLMSARLAHIGGKLEYGWSNGGVFKVEFSA